MSFSRFSYLEASTSKPNPPSDGIRVAMIEHNGVPIELIEFENKKKTRD